MQNEDGSWSGHHCITGRTFCTSAGVSNASRRPRSSSWPSKSTKPNSDTAEHLRRQEPQKTRRAVKPSYLLTLFVFFVAIELEDIAMIARRQFIIGCITAFTTALLDRRSLAEHNTDIINRIEESIGAAVKFLTTRQAQDGAWRSEIYGPFKDGSSLTSLIAATLAPLQHHDAHSAWSPSGQILRPRSSARTSQRPPLRNDVSRIYRRWRSRRAGKPH